jgi:hypothetical protein
LLTSRHLALLRAAMTFFDEEMSPHGSQIMTPYLDEPLDPVPTASDVAELRTLIQNSQLRYVRCDATTTRLLDDRLYASMEAAERRRTDPNERVVTALCFERSL